MHIEPNSTWADEKAEYEKADHAQLLVHSASFRGPAGLLVVWLGSCTASCFSGLHSREVGLVKLRTTWDEKLAFLSSCRDL